MSNHQKQSLNKLEKKKKEEKSALNMRFVRGLDIAAQGNVRKIVPSTTSATLYKVKSQKDKDTEYDVIVYKDGDFICHCADFQNRPWVTCKHIYAVICSDVSLEVKIVSQPKEEEVKADPRETYTVALGSEFNP